jgi:Fe-S cluster biogenesis protein NfuA
MTNELVRQLRSRIELALDRLRPALLADGGNVELLDVAEDGTARVEFQGACATCPAQGATLRLALEPALKREVPTLTAVVPVATLARREASPLRG